jgi:hypothetical protein
MDDMDDQMIESKKNPYTSLLILSSLKFYIY